MPDPPNHLIGRFRSHINGLAAVERGSPVWVAIQILETYLIADETSSGPILKV